MCTDSACPPEPGPLQPHGISCIDNVVKECEEEASIPQELARRARAVGAVSYTSFKVCAMEWPTKRVARQRLLL